MIKARLRTGNRTCYSTFVLGNFTVSSKQSGGTISALKTQTEFIAKKKPKLLNSLNDSIEYVLDVHTQNSSLC